MTEGEKPAAIAEAEGQEEAEPQMTAGARPAAIAEAEVEESAATRSATNSSEDGV
jgi:hypothetical protein